MGQVVDASDYSVDAHYEYDPYGNEVDPDPTPPDPYDDINPFRFSTKWLDTELAGPGINGAIGNTGLYYFGYRYYSPRLGRWLNRDPLQEQGGLNIYAFVTNNPCDHTDPLGLGLLDYIECIGNCISDINNEMWNCLGAAAIAGLEAAGCACSYPTEKPGPFPGQKPTEGAVMKLRRCLTKIGIKGKTSTMICKNLARYGHAYVPIAVGLLEGAIDIYCAKICWNEW